MKLKGLKDEDFINYKKPSMFLIFPTCTFKCDYENECKLCQNSSLAHLPDIEYSCQDIIDRYKANPITKAIVCGGLEPFDSEPELLHFVRQVRANGIKDDIVIYTGYTEEELRYNSYFMSISAYDDIYVKFGRYRPGNEPHYDEVLGVKLASDNQYGKKVEVDEFFKNIYKPQQGRI